MAANQNKTFVRQGDPVDELFALVPDCGTESNRTTSAHAAVVTGNILAGIQGKQASQAGDRDPSKKPCEYSKSKGADYRIFQSWKGYSSAEGG